jgi:hypothetical protein
MIPPGSLMMERCCRSTLLVVDQTKYTRSWEDCNMSVAVAAGLYKTGDLRCAVVLAWPSPPPGYIDVGRRGKKEMGPKRLHPQVAGAQTRSDCCARSNQRAQTCTRDRQRALQSEASAYRPSSVCGPTTARMSGARGPRCKPKYTAKEGEHPVGCGRRQRLCGTAVPVEDSREGVAPEETCYIIARICWSPRQQMQR